MEVLLPLLQALGLTLVLEGLLILLITRKRTMFLLSLTGNFITNPLLNFCVLLVRFSVIPLPLVPSVIVLEVLAVLVETLVYRRGSGEKWRYCLELSLFANVLSFGIGQILLGGL